MFSTRRNVLAICAVLLCLAAPAFAAIEDLPGMDTAANMKEWLKLSDDGPADDSATLAQADEV
jgi:hypothetical protein